jgi:hypothetical protein
MPFDIETLLNNLQIKKKKRNDTTYHEVFCESYLIHVQIESIEDETDPISWNVAFDSRDGLQQVCLKFYRDGNVRVINNGGTGRICHGFHDVLLELNDSTNILSECMYGIVKQSLGGFVYRTKARQRKSRQNGLKALPTPRHNKPPVS